MFDATVSTFASPKNKTLMVPDTVPQISLVFVEEGVIVGVGVFVGVSVFVGVFVGV
jgi:hypothetical protein